MENQEQNPSGTELEAKLEQLNRFTRRTLTQEEVFLFDVRLCDNEIDRDGERFSLEALEQLKALFVGKTGIFDHDPKGENQTARIYAAELVQEPERVTSAGEVYTFLKGHAYMVRTDANRDLIREIDGGIKKEVSISCAAVSQTCSVCGSDRRKNPCAHRVGQLYGEKRCHVVLSDVTDAYEWSFVAVPAQREAGVTKQFGMETDGERRCKQLEQQLQNRNALLNRVENSRGRKLCGCGFWWRAVRHKMRFLLRWNACRWRNCWGFRKRSAPSKSISVRHSCGHRSRRNRTGRFEWDKTVKLKKRRSAP